MTAELAPDPAEHEADFQARRRERYALLNVARRASSRLSTVKCRRTRVAEVVDVVKTKGGRVSFNGIHTCKSVWSCPVCAAARRATYGDQITEVTNAREVSCGGRALMLTLTLRHGRGHALGPLISAMSRAWARVTRGAPWERFRRKLGAGWNGAELDFVRVFEVTHGRNGWHPHIHALLYPGRALGDCTECAGKGCDACDMKGAEVHQVRLWLGRRWIRAVAAELPAGNVPTFDGIDLRQRGRADYLAKMGLELTETAGKTRGKTKPVWALLQGGGRRGRVLWREFEAAMLGRRLTGWSRGLDSLRKTAADKVESERTAERELDVVIASLLPCQWEATYRQQAFVAQVFETTTVVDAFSYIRALSLSADYHARAAVAAAA